MILRLTVVFVAALASCIPQAQAAETQLEKDQRHREAIAPVLAFIATAKTITVFEGGHRRGIDRAEELPEEGTFEEGSFRFHDKPLKLPTTQIRKLMKILSNEHSYDGGKMCGGFNPDVMIEFKTGSETYAVMLCFGCAEARISHGREVLFTELKAYNRLKNLLTKYYQHPAE